MESYQDPAAEPVDQLDAAPIHRTEDTRDQAQAMETLTEGAGPYPDNSEIEEVEKLSDLGSLADDNHVSQKSTDNENVSQDPATANDTADEVSTTRYPVTESAMALLKKTAARLEIMIERLHTMEAHDHMVNDRLGAVDTYIGKTEEYIQTVNKCLKVIEASTNEYFQKGHDHFDFVDASIQNTYEYLQTMDNHLEAVDNSLHTIIGRLDDAEERFETVEQSLQTVCNSHQIVTNGFWTIDGRLDTIDGELRTVNEHFGAIKKILQILGERLDTIDKKFQNANDHLNPDEKNLHSIVEVLDTINENIESGDGRLDNMQGHLHDIDGHLKSMHEECIHDSGHIKSIQEQLDKFVNITDEQLTNSADIKGVYKDLEQAMDRMDKQHSQNHIQTIQQLKVLDERMNTTEEIHAKSDRQTTERLITIDEKIDSLGQEIQDKAFSNDERMKLVTHDIVNLEKRVEATDMTEILVRINKIDSNFADYMEITNSILSGKASADQQFVEQQANISDRLTTLVEALDLISAHTNATQERQDTITESINSLDEGICDRLTIVSNNVLRLRNNIEDAGQSATPSVETLNIEMKKNSECGLRLKNDLKDLAKATVSSIKGLKEEVIVEKKERAKNHADVVKRLEALEKVITSMEGKIGDIDQCTLAVAVSSTQKNKHESTQTQSIVQDITNLGQRMIFGAAEMVGLLEQALQEVICKYEYLDKTISATEKMIETTKAHASGLTELSKRVQKKGASQATSLEDDMKAKLDALEATITSIRYTAIGVYGRSFFQPLPLKEVQKTVSKRTIEIQKYHKELNATRVRNLAVKTGQESNMSTITSFLEVSTQLLPLTEKMRTLDQETKHLLSAIATAELSSEKDQIQQNALTKLLLRQLDKLSVNVTDLRTQVTGTDTELSTTIPRAEAIDDIVKKTEDIAATTQNIYDSLILFKKALQNIAMRTADISRSTSRIKIELKHPKLTLEELKTKMAQCDGRNDRDVIDATQTSQSLAWSTSGVQGNAADSNRSNWTIMGTLLWLLWFTAVLVGLLAVLIVVGVVHEGKFVMHNGELVIRI